MFTATMPCTVSKVAVVGVVPRASVVVRASADRRAVLGGVAVGLASLVADKASALTDIDLFDDRKVMDTGFDLIYEARDLDLSQNERDGISQFRGDLDATKKRVNESTRRINDVVAVMVSKAYWTKAKEEMRLQVGNMRMDVLTLAAAKPTKAEKKEALALGKDFFTKANDFDFAMRKKDQSQADAAFAKVQSSLATLRANIIA